MSSALAMLRRVWEDDIESDYGNGLLPYEGTLQGAMFHHIRRKGGTGLQVFAEVRDFLGSKRPDLVVAKGRRIEAVIELKLMLRGILYQPDIDKLASWAKGRQRTHDLELNPETMKLRSSYRLTPATDWIFAAIGFSGYNAFNIQLVRERVRRTFRKAPLRRFWLFAGEVDKTNRTWKFSTARL